MMTTNEKNYRNVLMNGKKERATQPTGMTPPSKAPTNNHCDAPPQDEHETNNNTAQVVEDDEIHLGKLAIEELDQEEEEYDPTRLCWRMDEKAEPKRPTPRTLNKDFKPNHSDCKRTREEARLHYLYL